MLPEDRDPAYLWDMLDYARTARDFTTRVSSHQYMHDRILQLAVERLIEVIGEAARRVSSTFKQAHPEIPWGNIIAQRNVITHEYGVIKHERLWVVASERIPELIALLEPLVPSLPPDVES